MIPMVLWVAIPIVVIVAVIAVIVMARKKKRARPAANADVFRALLNNPGGNQSVVMDGGGPEVEKLRQNLRVKLLYQEDKVREAVEIERERNPGGTLLEWMRAAVDRWERDNR